MIDKRIGVALAAATLAWLPAQPAYAIFHWCKGCGTPVVAGYAPAPVMPYAVGYAPYVASYAPACPSPCGSACAAPCADGELRAAGELSHRLLQHAGRGLSADAGLWPVRPDDRDASDDDLRHGGPARAVHLVSSGGRRLRAGLPLAVCDGRLRAAPPVAAASYYAPAVGAAAPACCTASYAAPTTSSYAPAVTAGYAAPAPAPQTYSPAPAAAPTPLGTPGSSFQSQPPASAYPSNPAPSQPQPSEQTQPNQTFENPSGQPAPEPQSRIVLPPRTTNSTTSGVPRSLDPEDALDQSTAIPLRRSVAMRPVSTASAPQSTDLSDQGWRSARKQ